MTDSIPVFEQFTQEQIASDPLFKVEEKKADETWSMRISSVAVGGGFRVHRTEGESTRQLKRRVNAAAGSELGGFKVLEWKPESKNLPDGQPSSYLVRVKALDLKAKAEAEEARKKASQNGSQGSPEGVQTTEGEKPVEPVVEEEPAQIGRRAR
jgi:hypothetical protein